MVPEKSSTTTEMKTSKKDRSRGSQLEGPKTREQPRGGDVDSENLIHTGGDFRDAEDHAESKEDAKSPASRLQAIIFGAIVGFIIFLGPGMLVYSDTSVAIAPVPTVLAVVCGGLTAGILRGSNSNEGALVGGFSQGITGILITPIAVMPFAFSSNLGLFGVLIIWSAAVSLFLGMISGMFGSRLSNRQFTSSDGDHRASPLE